MDMNNRNKTEDLKKLAVAFFDNLEVDTSREFGSIGLNCKRPFGNSDVLVDILEIIEWEPDCCCHQCGNTYTEAQTYYASCLYFEYLIPHLQKTFKERS